MVDSAGNLKARRLPLLLLCANVFGSATYVWRASNGWAIPEEHCEIPVTGEPLVWFGAIVPVVIAFFLLNAFWVTDAIRKRRSNDLPFFAATALAWLAAIAIDFNHHC